MKVDGNIWEGFKNMCIECGNEKCDVWMPIKVPEGWNGDGEDFRCGVCMVKEMRQLSMDNGELKREVERMRHVEEEMKEA